MYFSGRSFLRVKIKPNESNGNGIVIKTHTVIGMNKPSETNKTRMSIIEDNVYNSYVFRLLNTIDTAVLNDTVVFEIEYAGDEGVGLLDIEFSLWKAEAFDSKELRDGKEELIESLMRYKSYYMIKGVEKGFSELCPVLFVPNRTAVVYTYFTAFVDCMLNSF